jgi:hypothetical protein
MPEVQISSIRQNLPASVGYTTGKYYSPSLVAGQRSANNLTQAIDHFVPLILRRSVTVDRLALYNTTAVTVNFRLGIYADNGGGHPGSLLVDSGQITTSGSAGDNVATISQALTANTLYWLAFNVDTTAQFETIANVSGASGLHADVADFATVAQPALGFIIHSAARAYAAFPSTASAVDGGQLAAPRIRWRVA